MTSATAHEIAYTIGLLAGDGSFFVTITRDDRYKHGVYYGPKFSLSMGEYTEEMLNVQHELYELGTVTKATKGYQWVISSREDCHAFRDHINGYLDDHDAPEFTSTPKYDAYQRWCDALEILQPGNKLSKGEILELAKIRDSINYLAAPSRITADEVNQILYDNDT